MMRRCKLLLLEELGSWFQYQQMLSLGHYSKVPPRWICG